MILFFTVIICLTSQILCRRKTPSELRVLGPSSQAPCFILLQHHHHHLLFEMWIFILSLLVKTNESFQAVVQLKYFLVYVFSCHLSPGKWLPIALEPSRI